jgi:phospholipid/cholesterol/gamma-HCH transport system substrate-binding protein
MNLVDTQAPAIRERRFLVRTGLFVSGALLLAMIVVALIGKERRLFERSFRYRAAFENVEGLRVDSPVWLGGLDVGRVKSISFSEDLSDSRIQVELEISSQYADRIRADSVARVSSRGVLGDKAVDVSLGTADAAKLASGAELATGIASDLGSLLKSGGEVMDNAVAITRDLRKAVTVYADPELAGDVKGTVGSVRRLLEQVEKGDGAVHALLFDPATRKDVQSLLKGAARTAQKLDGAVAETELILRGVRTGPGAAHALIYDRRTGDALGQLGNAAGELATLISDARKSPKGAIHQLVYGDQSNLIADLGATAADLRAVVGKIRAGDGSLGALINDPTVYEDLKTILGNVKRNRILRALVRYSLSNRDQLEGVGEPMPANARGAATLVSPAAVSGGK